MMAGVTTLRKAFPIARKHKAPLTIFIVARKIGSRAAVSGLSRQRQSLGVGIDAGATQRQRDIEQIIERLKSPSIAGAQAPDRPHHKRKIMVRIAALKLIAP